MENKQTNSPNNFEEDSIDIIALIKNIWIERKFIIKITISFFIIGCIVAILSPEKYTSQTTFVPQVSGDEISSNRTQLSSLASLAGINLNPTEMKSDSYLSPLVYKNIINSEEFSLKLINEELTQEIKSNNELIKNVDLENIVYYKSSILVKNTEEEYLISGGRNINLEKNDLILNEEGFVVGYVVKIFDDHSLINTIINTDFSIPGIDKYGNQYLITSNMEELLVNSIAVEEINLNIDYISTDVAFNHLAKFPIVKLSNVEISNANNKISAIVDINYTFNFDSNIYIVKDK